MQLFGCKPTAKVNEGFNHLFSCTKSTNFVDQNDKLGYGEGRYKICADTFQTQEFSFLMVYCLSRKLFAVIRSAFLSSKMLISSFVYFQSYLARQTNSNEGENMIF